MLSQKKESLIGLDHKHNMETNLSNTYTHTSKNVIPTNYELMLKPDLNTFTFQGEVNITVDISKPVDSITLNSAELDIKEVAIKSGDANIIPSSINSHEDNETITLGLDDKITNHAAIITIKFAGVLNDRLLGFYRSKYLDVQGEERYLAATQFESTDARRAFPCWDEPERKATFDVTLVIPQDLVALSNMPINSENILADGFRKVRFDRSPIMSTYLLAFIVGDMACIQKESQSGTLMRIWTTKGKEDQGQFALETSLRLLDYYNEYFGIPFPLPKLDHIALPDFAAGAMENWGAITYREVALLVDANNSSAGTKQLVASIISHEMAHMWFGDLVTMKWWNDLWLNESFASWMGDKAVDAIHPEWDMWTHFLTADTASAFSLDGLTNSHPIEQEVKNPAEIGQLFDAISYSKGGSVLRMLEDYIGQTDFRSGISAYLSHHSYSNAETADLWSALAKASGKPVGEMMDSWVQQTGFPVLSAEENKGQISLKQERFVYENIYSKSNNITSATWFIPVKINVEGIGNISSQLISSPEERIVIPEPLDGWFKLNPEQTGFYRVKYHPKNLSRLQSAIENGDLDDKDRLGLQSDAYALCKAGYSSASSFLRLASSYSQEDKAPVLSDLATNLRGIENLIEDQPYIGKYEEFCRDIFAGPSKLCGWDALKNEGHQQSLFRSTALSNMGHYGDKQTLDEATKRFFDYVKNPNQVHPDIRSVVFNLAAKMGDDETYKQMWELEKQSELQEEKVRFHSALGNFNDERQLKETLTRSLTNDIRVQDTIRVIVGVSSSRKGRSLAWDFIRNNWKELDRRYGDGGFALMRLVSIVSGFSSTDRLEEVEKFFEVNPAPAAERTIEQAKERILLNSNWVSKYSGELQKFFAN